MKILVTGATGFIGQHVTRWLVNHNYSVTASGTSANKAEKMDWYNDVEFKPCDYYNLDHIERGYGGQKATRMLWW